jgi:Cu-Zn family superoxide dismutase
VLFSPHSLHGNAEKESRMFSSMSKSMPKPRFSSLGSRLAVLVAVLLLAIAIPLTVSGGQTARTAGARLFDPAGNQVGVATFVELADGRVEVLVQARGLTPGVHGIHVHTVGACSPTFAAAGGHFNPAGEHHGHHAGDLNNITANLAGVAHLHATTSQFTLSQGAFSLFDADGSALIIHAGEDDLVSDPTGNSGARAVCGVIQGISRAR